MCLFFRIPYQKFHSTFGIQKTGDYDQFTDNTQKASEVRVNVDALFKVQWQGRTIMLLKFNYLEKRRKLG